MDVTRVISRIGTSGLPQTGSGIALTLADSPQERGPIQMEHPNAAPPSPKHRIHGDGAYPRRRVGAALLLIALTTAVNLLCNQQAIVLALVLLVALAVCLVVTPSSKVRSRLVGDSVIDLADPERRKLIFGFLILLAAWVAYLTLVNSIRDGIVAEHHAILLDRSTANLFTPDIINLKAGTIHRKRFDWWALTIGQLVIFQALLFFTYWLETCPTNKGFVRPLQTMWCVIGVLSIINVFSIPGDAVLIDSIVALYPIPNTPTP